MNLFINSPSFYTQENGVIDEIYQFCRRISHSIDVTKYTTALDTIGITPIIAPKQVIESGRWEEYKKISLTYRMADLSLLSDYDSYFDADIMLKKKMIKENIFRSLAEIKRKLKDRFDYDQMKKDIEALLS